MRRGRVFFYLAFILILGAVAVGVIYIKYLQPKAEEPTTEVTPTPVVELVHVVVVTQRVPRGNILDETVLSLIPIQRDLLIAGYFTDLSDVVSRRARVDLEANMLLTTGMVVDTAEQLSSTGSNAALSIPKGMVAVSIPISRLSSVSYAPQSGDHVNVIVTMLLMDLDSQYQSVLPNHSAAVISPGPGVVLGSSSGDSTEESLEQNNTADSSTTSSSTAVGATLQGENITNLTAQNIDGGPASVIGRAEVDPILAQTYYLVPSERQRPRLVSQNLLQDAVVLQVGNFEEDDQDATQAEATPPAEGAGEQGAPPEGGEIVVATPPPQPDVITLIVTPQDALTLNYLMFAGAQLTLALRPAGDDTRIQTEAATLDFLLKQYNIPVPVKLPYGFEPRVDDLDLPVLKNDYPTPEP